MTSAALEPQGEPHGSRWVRRAVLVTLSLGLITIVAATFTRVIAARVPQQRATLEKLIADRTGLAVRFENVHFAWGLDGTSAVFERVVLTDPSRGRVRVVAPQLRVELDTWDFLKHQQFSLGHVKLESPDIEIIGEPEPVPGTKAPAARADSSVNGGARSLDERAAIRRFIAWAELMPIGRVEVEGARVHLMRRGDPAPRHSFTLSQANVNRGAHDINAFGTLLLSQDIGQSLFISTKLDGLGSASGVSGEARLIARRVLLEKMELGVARGRGTLDARLQLRDGRVHAGNWHASARELEFTQGVRFDHFTVNGGLKRDREDVLLDFNDLQVTRGARLDRAPRLSARITLEPGTTRVARTTLQAERIPFMAAEFVAFALTPQLDRRQRGLPPEWTATAGELRSVRFDSSPRKLQAQIVAAELTRAADRARIGHLAANVELQDESLQLAFDPDNAVMVWMPGATEPRTLRLEGSLSLRETRNLPQLSFDKVALTSGDARVEAQGAWGGNSAGPLTVSMSHVDRALLGDVWALLSLEQELPQLADVRGGHITTGQLRLHPTVSQDTLAVDWSRSRGSMTLTGLESQGEKTPRLTNASGRLQLTRNGTQLRLDSGSIEDLELTQARVDWPRQGDARLQASLRGDLRSALLRRVAPGEDLDRLAGEVSLEAEARGADALADPALWRVTARLRGASIALGDDLPPVQALSGTVRYADGQLRATTLEGEWLGGTIKLESRRGGKPGPVNISGNSDAAQAVALWASNEPVRQVDGRVAWNGTLRKADDHWVVTLNSTLAGLESQLPEPFGKARGSTVPIRAELRVANGDVREFELTTEEGSIRGQRSPGVTTARIELQGVAGHLQSPATGDPRLELRTLELRRAPLLLGVAGALLAEDAELAVRIEELRHGGRALGPVQAGIAHRGSQLQFSFESDGESPHEFAATGSCSDSCRAEFSFDTRRLPELWNVESLPEEWPRQALRSSGELTWPRNVGQDVARQISGRFDVEAEGAHGGHQVAANAVLREGLVELANMQGTGPAADQVFRGVGRIALVSRSYDVTLDYERVALATSAVPSPARAGFARVWSALRGSAARQGWAEVPAPRRVQWHGTWPAEPPPTQD